VTPVFCAALYCVLLYCIVCGSIQVYVSTGVGRLSLLVVRSQGVVSDISVEWTTVDGSARSVVYHIEHLQVYPVWFYTGVCDRWCRPCVSVGGTFTRCCQRRLCRVDNCRRLCSQCWQTAARLPGELPSISRMQTLEFCLIMRLLPIL